MYPRTDEDLGNRLRDARREKKLTQAEVAQFIPGWHQTTVAKTEAGRRPLLATELLTLQRNGLDLLHDAASNQGIYEWAMTQIRSTLDAVDRIS